MTERTLSPARAKAFYDRFGRKQDAQAFYEDAALDDLVSHASFGTARTVFELGCGTGRLAVTLLRERLPEAAAAAVMGAWALAQRISPAAVGGCRPIESRRQPSPSRWRIDHHQVVTSYGIASEVVVASKIERAG
jgi:SAM-dependent methyltransferase